MPVKDGTRNLSRNIHMVISKNRGNQYRPQQILVLMLGTPRKLPLILGNPHIRLGGENRSRKASRRDVVLVCTMKLRLES